MKDELLPCPFCGGKGHIRSKIRYRTNQQYPRCTIGELVPTVGTLYGDVWTDNEYAVCDWSFGYQVYCGKCKAKTLYKWGGWHSYSDDELETLGTYDFHSHRPCAEDGLMMRAAMAAWNRRAG